MLRNAKGYRDRSMGSMHVTEGPCPAIIDTGPILNLAMAHHRRRRLQFDGHVRLVGQSVSCL
jgi:hypothetical protein